MVGIQRAHVLLFVSHLGIDAPHASEAGHGLERVARVASSWRVRRSQPHERGIASLEAHGEYLAGIPGHPPPRSMLTAVTALQGRRMGVGNAVLFRAHDFDAPPPIALEAMQQSDAGTS